MNINRTKIFANWLAGSIAIVVIVLIPLVFVSLEVRYAKGSLVSEAEINSRIISGMINVNPDMWQYEQMRLEEILSQRPQSGERETRRIIESNGNVIAESTDAVFHPLIKQSHDLRESGVIVGKIEICRSLRPLVWNTLYIFIIGVVIAVMVFIAIRVLPFRELIQAQEALFRSNEKYKILTESSQTGIYICRDDKIVYANSRFAGLHGHTVPELLNTSYVDLFHPSERVRAQEIKSNILGGEEVFRHHEMRRLKKNGGILWCQSIEVCIVYQGATAIMGNIVDISERKQTEFQRDMLIADLQKALAEVKTLSGLVPICAHCKNVRDDKGYWDKIEAYIHKHSDAEFSHGICPECAKKYYPDMHLYEDDM